MKHAVLLMAYGSPSRMEDVVEYLEGIYEGKPVPQYAIDENTKKYSMHGGKSPSNAIVEGIAHKLSHILSDDGEFRVFLGNKHWKPTLEDAVANLSEYGPDDIIAIPLFPFPSNNVENSYLTPLREAMNKLGVNAELRVINGFHMEPLFLDAWEEMLRPKVSELPDDTFYIFSAHSLPVMRNTEEEYRNSFFETADRLAVRLGLKRYAAAFQSRGKYGATWLEPSVEDVLLSNIDTIGENVMAIPLGFIYNHLEILYDLDLEFGSTVKSRGKKYLSTSPPNDSDTFVHALRNAVLARPEPINKREG